jgi:hypothetical protein
MEKQPSKLAAMATAKEMSADFSKEEITGK